MSARVMRRVMRDCMPALCILYACRYAKLYVVQGMPGGCPGNACGIPIPFFNYNPASYIYFFPTHHPQHLVVVFKCF
jgi:hypothetical protein